VLKKAFTIAPVLKIPNDEDPFKLSTDTSDFDTSAVLSQKNANYWIIASSCLFFQVIRYS